MAKQFCHINDPVLHLKVDSNTLREVTNIQGYESLCAILDVDLSALDGKVIYITYDLTDAALGNIENNIYNVVLRINGDPSVITVKPQFTVINGLVNSIGKTPGDNDYAVSLVVGGEYRIAFQYYFSEYDGYTGTEVGYDFWFYLPESMSSGCAFITLVDPGDGVNSLFLSPRLS